MWGFPSFSCPYVLANASWQIYQGIIGFVEEQRAESAVDALKENLALKCRCFRDAHWINDLDSSLLVPGDIVSLRIGDIVPADVRLLGLTNTGQETPEGVCLVIDQSALTGESLPVDKGKGAMIYSSSIVKQGQMLGMVTGTGTKTYIGRAATLMSRAALSSQGHFQKVVNRIGNFLILMTMFLVIILLLVNIFGKGYNFKTALKQLLILTIAAIPVGLPTVLSVTMAVGANELAKEKVIVKRLTAIEELASVSILCSGALLSCYKCKHARFIYLTMVDKTGTLTMNKLSFDKPYLAKKGVTSMNESGELYSERELLMYAFLASESGTQDSIEVAVRKAAMDHISDHSETDSHVPGYETTRFVPFNPTSKFTEATVKEEETGHKFICIKGAPHVVSGKCGGHPEADTAVREFASRGLRALGVARTVDPDMSRFEMVGMISLLDPPRPDSAQTIKECAELGINPK